MRTSRVTLLAVVLMAMGAVVLLAPAQAQARTRVAVTIGGGWGGWGGWGGLTIGGWYAPRVYTPYYVYPSTAWYPAPYYGAGVYAVPYYYPQPLLGWGGHYYYHHHHHHRR